MIVPIGLLQHELAFGQPGGGEKSMIRSEADAKFLGRILMLLVAGTLATGLMAGLATVKAERAMALEQIAQ